MKARLVIDNTRRSADLLYLTRLESPDPVVWMQIGRSRVLMLPEMEIDRARIEAKADHLVRASEYQSKAAKKFTRSSPALAASVFLGEKGVRAVEVPQSFPAGYYLELRAAGFDVVVSEEAFVPSRRKKKKWEIAEIKRSVRLGAKGIAAALDMIRMAAVQGGNLVLDGRPLTSERIRGQVTRFLVSKGYSAEYLIVSGRREHTSLPHHAGSGVLRAGEAILLDFSPRSLRSGYHGDITRTVVKGKAGAGLKAMYRAVRAVERDISRMIRPGARGADLHKRAVKMFERRGFTTGRRGGVARGFFHGLGHGLGLEIHEKPSVSAGGEVLMEGDVVTIEPGLYYPETGGVRHENVYAVTAGGCQPLTDFDVDLEID